ncbi:MAG: phosphocholine cytidylyltransferase family protein [Nitrospinae bacterium]|nr:phosphocholine cytidylyltransferase family protein [Nitrospinota bacterium]
MGEVTVDTPKCLASIGGKPMLQWQMAALREAGIGKISIVTGYKREKLEAYAGDSVGFYHNPRWAETNMVSSLVTASSVLSGDGCVVSYSDIVYHPSVIKTLIAAEGDVCVTYDTQWLELWGIRFPDPLEDAETFREEGGRLREIGGKPASLEQIEGQYMGLLKFTPAGWRGVSGALAALPEDRRGKMDMTSLLSHLLRLGIPVETVAVRGRWLEVDSVGDIIAYEKKLAGADTFSHDWRW